MLCDQQIDGGSDVYPCSWILRRPSTAAPPLRPRPARSTRSRSSTAPVARSSSSLARRTPPASSRSFAAARTINYSTDQCDLDCVVHKYQHRAARALPGRSTSASRRPRRARCAATRAATRSPCSRRRSIRWGIHHADRLQRLLPDGPGGSRAITHRRPTATTGRAERKLRAAFRCPCRLRLVSDLISTGRRGNQPHSRTWLLALLAFAALTAFALLAVWARFESPAPWEPAFMESIALSGGPLDPTRAWRSTCWATC